MCMHLLWGWRHLTPWHVHSVGRQLLSPPTCVALSFSRSSFSFCVVCDRYCIWLRSFLQVMMRQRCPGEGMRRHALSVSRQLWHGVAVHCVWRGSLWHYLPQKPVPPTATHLICSSMMEISSLRFSLSCASSFSCWLRVRWARCTRMGVLFWRGGLPWEWIDSVM